MAFDYWLAISSACGFVIAYLVSTKPRPASIYFALFAVVAVCFGIAGAVSFLTALAIRYFQGEIPSSKAKSGK